MWKDGNVNLSTEKSRGAVSEFGSLPMLHLRALSLPHFAPHLPETVNMLYIVHNHTSQLL